MNKNEAIEEAIELIVGERDEARSNGEEEYADHLTQIVIGLESGDGLVDSPLGDVLPPTTDPRFWDCDCDTTYIHSKSVDTFCPLCGVDLIDPAFNAGISDARVIEIAQGGKFATDESWLHAYNLEEYYDSLDWYDTHRYSGAEVASIEAIMIFRRQERA